MKDDESVYLGTWSGSTRLVTSVVSVGAAMPVTDETISAGLVPKEAMEHAVGGRLTKARGKPRPFRA